MGVAAQRIPYPMPRCSLIVLDQRKRNSLPVLCRSLMCEAQREFDSRAGPMCPDQLTAPVLHKVSGQKGG
eukprot:1158678-Pelagomonas_calceolata.AAC.4